MSYLTSVIYDYFKCSDKYYSDTCMYPAFKGQSIETESLNGLTVECYYTLMT